MLIQNQAMVRILWLRKLQKRLQQSLDVSRGKQIVAASNQAHLLESIVHHDGEMIRDWNVLARQHDVAQHGRVDGNKSVFAARPST